MAKGKPATCSPGSPLQRLFRIDQPHQRDDVLHGRDEPSFIRHVLQQELSHVLEKLNRRRFQLIEA